MITVDDARKAWNHMQLTKSPVVTHPFPDEIVPIDINVPFTHDICFTAHEYAEMLTEDEDFEFVLPYKYVMFRGKFFDAPSTGTDSAVLASYDTAGGHSSITLLNLEDIPSNKPSKFVERMQRRAGSTVYLCFGIRLIKTEIAGKFQLIRFTNGLVECTNLDEGYEELQAGFWTLYGMLNMKHFDKTVREPSSRKNEKRIAKGLDPLPTTIHISLNPKIINAYQGGTHNSPRPHWRRGHLRTLPSGKTVPVQPHMVMGEAPIPKGYVVKA